MMIQAQAQAQLAVLGMDPAVSVALIAAVIGPVILNILNGRNRREEKRADWKREDAKEKERRDREAAQALKLQKVAEVVDTVHELVNSSLTAAIEEALDSSRGQLISLNELIALREVVSGNPPNDHAKAAVAGLEHKIATLGDQLQDRREQGARIGDAAAAQRAANGH